MVINLDPTGRILGSSGFRPQKQLCWYQDRRGPKRKKKKRKTQRKRKRPEDKILDWIHTDTESTFFKQWLGLQRKDKTINSCSEMLWELSITPHGPSEAPIKSDGEVRMITFIFQVIKQKPRVTKKTRRPSMVQHRLCKGGTGIRGWGTFWTVADLFYMLVAW